MTLTLHVGLRKTATTTLQHAMSRGKPMPAGHGLLLPGRPEDHHRLGRRVRTGAGRAAVRQALPPLAAEARAAGPDRVLVSSEHPIPAPEAALAGLRELPGKIAGGLFVLASEVQERVIARSRGDVALLRAEFGLDIRPEPMTDHAAPTLSAGAVLVMVQEILERVEGRPDWPPAPRPEAVTEERAMGREAEGHARFRGQEGAVRAFLESEGIILRGEMRVKVRRGALSEWRAEGDDLVLRADGEPMVLTLGAKEAAAWVKALDRPVPSLAAKLGVSASARAWVIGGPPPEELALAVAGADAGGPEAAAVIVAVLTGPGDLEAALAAGQRHGLRVWCVHGKGKGAAVPDAAVRDAFRAAGWRDIKASAMSGDFTATLYRPRGE